MPSYRLFGFGLLAACAHGRVPQEDAAPLVVPPIASAPTPVPRPIARPVSAPAGVKTAREVLEHAEWVGQPVTVSIVEPLHDAEHSSAADAGEYDVSVANVGPKRFKVTPAESAEERAAGGLAALPMDLRSPVVVTGVVARSNIGIRIIASKIEASTYPAPVVARNGKAITDDPQRWNGKYVQVEDIWETGFESSSLASGSVWVAAYPNVTKRCEPPATPAAGRMGARRRVRLTGYVYTESKRYGHLGMASGEIVATEIVYLDPSRPECR